ncbi:MAG: GatB/YqeY domain-containing protein [Melioribacteraceae bacterium]|nr:GatB/YqeY domain-containing protein [Melioribacteraceae bacterium]
MSLKDKINDDLKAAMKAKDKIRLETIRSIRALILEFEKSGTDKELTLEDEIKMLTAAAKKRKEAIEQFDNAGRTELAEKEKAELAIIHEYLPKQLTDEEVEAEIRKIADEVGAKEKSDFPKLMPAAIKALKGKADGKVIKGIVDKILS